MRFVNNRTYSIYYTSFCAFEKIQLLNEINTNKWLSIVSMRRLAKCVCDVLMTDVGETWDDVVGQAAQAKLLPLCAWLIE